MQVNKKNLSRERGFSLFEVMAAIFLCSILGLSIAGGLIFATKTRKIVELTNIARNLAVSKVELLSAKPTNLLTSASGGTEENLTVSGHHIKFKRVTTITVNSDSSRTVNVVVSSQSANSHLPYPVSFTSTFAIWN